MSYSTKKPLNYKNKAKQDYRKKLIKNIPKDAKNIVWIGFDAELGLESKYIAAKLGKRLSLFINLERDKNILEKWFSLDKHECLGLNLNIYNPLHLSKLCQLVENLKSDGYYVVINLDLIGFLSPSLLTILKQFKQLDVNHLFVNVQDIRNGVRGPRWSSPNIRELVKSSKKRTYTNFTQYRLNMILKSEYELKTVDQTKTSVRPMVNYEFIKKAA